MFQDRGNILELYQFYILNDLTKTDKFQVLNIFVIMDI